ncbi:hypothetical protein NQ318_013357 [Aromia moschata]|uniref:Uncharacterized protein n=1 Tax=Aromia moschata TaxID=1265417 RepID=A0AAV8XVY6_9CUCU|nr:hypothetical protein NQ318_013357 [Aromia moschata]
MYFHNLNVGIQMVLRGPDPSAMNAGASVPPSAGPPYSFYGGYWYPQSYGSGGYMQNYQPYQQYQQYPGGQQYCVMPQQGQWSGPPGQQPNVPVMYGSVQKYPSQ